MLVPRKTISDHDCHKSNAFAGNVYKGKEKHYHMKIANLFVDTKVLSELQVYIRYGKLSSLLDFSREKELALGAVS